MKLVLANGVELSPMTALGGPRLIQNQNRDTLSFIFNPNYTTLTELDSLFVPENCEILKVIDNSDFEYIYKGYTIRAELSKTTVQVSEDAETNEPIFEERITISMAQKTYLETQLNNLTETVDILVMESLIKE